MVPTQLPRCDLAQTGWVWWGSGGSARRAKPGEEARLMFVCLDAPSPAAPPSFRFSLVITSAGGRPPRAPIAASPLRVEARLLGGAAAEICSWKAAGERCARSRRPPSIRAWRPQKQQLQAGGSECGWVLPVLRVGELGPGGDPHVGQRCDTRPDARAGQQWAAGGFIWERFHCLIHRKPVSNTPEEVEG